MSDTPRIEGIPDPRKSSQLTSDDSIDPEKFKRILKVEDSDEAQKQNKKNKSQKQEEEEALENKELNQNIAKEGAFGAFLTETQKKEDPFAVKGVKKSIIETSPTNLDLPKSPFELSASEQKKKKKVTAPSLNFEEALPNAFVTSRRDISFLKTESAENHAVKDVPQIPLAPLSSAELESEEKTNIAPLELEALISTRETDQKKLDPQNEPVQATQAIPIVTPPLLTTKTPAYASLHEHVFELFEKMIGLMMIQEYKGISITTVKLSMPGSVFNGCEIKLEHYDTARHAFNIQLLGNPDAVDLFNANFDGLVNSFSQSKYSFQANIRRPVLLDTYRNLTKKKGAPTADDDTPTEHAI